MTKPLFSRWFPAGWLRSQGLPMISLPLNLRRSGKRWGYGLLALAIALGIGLGSGEAAYGWSLRDLLRGGAQIMQGIQIANMSDQQEMDVGRQINQDLMSKQFKRFNDPNLQGYVNAIGQRLVPHSTRPTLTYTFQVIDSREVNAFATMGGYVYVTTGLMRLAENEAELAGVIGHEIGHIEGKHLINQIRDTAIQQGLLTATTLDRSTIVNLAVNLAVSRPHSRRDERDSDQRGLRMMGQARYAQGAMATFMRKLASQGGSPPQFLSTHPSSASRVQDIESSIDPNLRQGDGMSPEAYRQQTAMLPR
jgi:beta-barrel assembly-enhancing protease